MLCLAITKARSMLVVFLGSGRHRKSKRHPSQRGRLLRWASQRHDPIAYLPVFENGVRSLVATSQDYVLKARSWLWNISAVEAGFRVWPCYRRASRWASRQTHGYP